MNSLAAIACTEAIGLPFDTIRKGLLSFGGTHRRFEYKGSLGDVTVIDDYAHHPTEIRATLSALKPLQTQGETPLYGCMYEAGR